MYRRIIYHTSIITSPRLLLALLPFAIFCGIACNRVPNRSNSAIDTTHDRNRESFDVVSLRVLESLKQANWEKLRKDAAPDILLAQIYSLSSGNWSKQQRLDIFPDLLFGGDVDEISTLSAPIGTYSIAGIQIHNDVLILSKQQECFKKFCHDVNTTNSNRPDWIERSEYIEAYDIDLLKGPAIRGKLVSSDHWYVEFTRYQERWVVSRLIRTAH